MNLVIVESPTKAKTISKFLGKDFKVESSYGHVRDLPKGKLGIDVENNFEPQYVTPRKVQKQVTALKKLAKKADKIILATDEDREGEAIAWHLAQALGLITVDKKQLTTDKPGAKSKASSVFERIVFHEITESAIQKALKNPRDIKIELVNAQQGRRVLDRLVGYKLSPFLWKKIASGLSAGRVQSVALRLIVEREEEIRAFKPDEYWTISVDLNTKGRSEDKFTADLVKIDGKALDKLEIKNKNEAEKIAKDLEDSAYRVANVTQRELKRNPSPPFITSTLQQEASKRLGYSAKKTMMFAQRLYERGYITYMRTDSLNLSEESLRGAANWIKSSLGDKYTLDAPRRFKSKSKLAQEAHEAIRPTNPKFDPDAIKGKKLEAAEAKLYELIWRRFIASQLPQAVFMNTAIEIDADKYGLRSTGIIMKFDGFLKIWPTKFSEKELPEVTSGDSLDMLGVNPLQHFTEPPPRFNEASLIKALESYGIGRPSTYASIISVILARNYVTKEARRFQPTEIGEMVNKLLVENFSEIIDINFTAKMEDGLDNVALGKENWRELIALFYSPFNRTLEEKYEEVKKVVKDEKTDEVCEKCGKPMIIKFGRFGKFMACSGFPDCKNTKSLGENNRNSESFGTCPKCNVGEIVKKRTKKGRFFWGCNKYPECDHATWKNPKDEDKK